VFLIAKLIFESTCFFAFREWMLLLYAINYLISPFITYQLDESYITYPMKLPSRVYFEIALPGFLALFFGVYFFKTRIFNPNIEKIKADSFKNELLLKNLVFLGLILRISQSIFPGELAFLVYLISLLRFVGVYSLYALNSKKYWVWVLLVLLIELYFASIIAMYHDAIMWVLFFVLYFIYIKKPNILVRLTGVVLIVFFLLFVQNLKVEYRAKLADLGPANLESVIEASSTASDQMTSEGNLLNSLVRANQAWIFASTIDRMDRIGDFQGFHILGLYLEAALFPRFLAPGKINSGNKDIFNRFSGHTINTNTSMGLGVFADGYIAFGFWGVVLFAFGLGLLFSTTFLIIESWSKISEFYILFLLPLLAYAVRPDCELQTIINHLSKGLIVFGIFITLTKFNFVMGGHSNAKVKRSLMPLIK
jgi:hypothetical protein